MTTSSCSAARTRLYTDVRLLENILSKASGKTELEQPGQSCGFGLVLGFGFVLVFFKPVSGVLFRNS